MGGVGQGKGKRPINVKFEIPYFTTSGIQVRYLKIIEPKVSLFQFFSLLSDAPPPKNPSFFRDAASITDGLSLSGPLHVQEMHGCLVCGS